MEDSSIKTHKNNNETLPDQWETLVLNLPKPVFLFSSKIIAEDINKGNAFINNNVVRST